MNVRNYFLLVLVVVFCFSCSVQPNSSLTISNGEKDFTLVACNNAKREQELVARNDSLSIALSQNKVALEQVMQTIADIQDGFRAINEAEGRVAIQVGQEGITDSQRTLLCCLRFDTPSLLPHPIRLECRLQFQQWHRIQHTYLRPIHQC